MILFSKKQGGLKILGQLRSICVKIVFALVFTSVHPAMAQSSAVLSGSEFLEQLRQPSGIAWSDMPLRLAIETLGRDQQIGVMLDRRTDPGRLISLNVAPQPLEHLLTTLARQTGLGVCYVDAVAYFGPTETTQILATVAAMRRREAEQLPREAAHRCTRVNSLRWPMLAVPRELITELAGEARLDIVNADLVPHDLWPAVALPPLPWADRMTLVLAGFGLTFEFTSEGAAIRLTPMPKTAAIVQTYPGKGHAQENARRIAAGFPEAQVTVEGDQLRIAGPWEVHRAVEELMQGKRVSRRQPSNTQRRTVYTLQVENEPVGGVILALAKQLNLKVEISTVTEGKLEERISFHVTDVTRDELLQAVLAPVNLRFRVTGGELQVYSP
jgi:hypothetical protein